MCGVVVVLGGEESLRYKYNEFDLFEDIKYTLDEEFLEEFIKQIKGKLS